MRLAAVVLLLLSALAQAEVGPGATRRLAICVGSDDGGRERQRLRFATSDAQSVCRLFNELGGVAPEDSFLLLNPSRSQIEAAFEHVRELSHGDPKGNGLELVFYYSGHSSDEALLLGKEQFSYPDFRALFESIPVQVRIAVLDSCLSGSFTRLKGGKAVAPFLVDVSSSVHGRAVLTSSSATEASQESDRIRGSFFTHYLLSGLRGAADTSHDGRVTLSEAYQFAFAETLARTQNTKAGAQHPSYEMDLAGTGDVVMTDLRKVSAKLVLGKELEGKVFVRDGLQQLLLELRKSAGQPVELGVPAGTYTVTVEHKDATYAAEIALLKDQESPVPAYSFHKLSREQNALRGGNAEAELDDAPEGGEVPSALARGELIIFQTVHGIGEGVLLCALYNCGEQATVGVAAAGAALGAGAAAFFSRDGVTPGQTLAVDVGTQWGLANGLLLDGALLQKNGLGAAMIGMGTGTVAGGMIAYWVKPRAGQVAVVDSVGLWSGGLTTLLLAGFSHGGSTRVAEGVVLLASDTGLAGAALLAHKVNISRGRVVLINAGGVLGGVFGLATALFTGAANGPNQGHALALGAAFGAGAGLATGAYLTRNLDLPSAPSASLMPMSAGRPGLSFAATW